jgi:hypothetical protein
MASERRAGCGYLDRTRKLECATASPTFIYGPGDFLPSAEGPSSGEQSIALFQADLLERFDERLYRPLMSSWSAPCDVPVGWPRDSPARSLRLACVQDEEPWASDRDHGPSGDRFSQ